MQSYNNATILLPLHIPGNQTEEEALTGEKSDTISNTHTHQPSSSLDPFYEVKKDDPKVTHIQSRAR